MRVPVGLLTACQDSGIVKSQWKEVSDTVKTAQEHSVVRFDSVSRVLWSVAYDLQRATKLGG